MAVALAENPTFPIETYHRRWERVRGMMADQQLDALVIWSLNGNDYWQNVQYLAGDVITNTCLFFPAVGDPVGFAQPSAIYPLANKLAHCEIRDGGADYIPQLTAAIEAAGAGRGHIGLVEIDSLRSRGLPHTLVDALRERFPHARFSTVTIDFEILRITLAPEEVPWLDRAGSELDRVMDFLVDAVRPGATLGQIERDTKAWAAEQGLRLSALSMRAAKMDFSTPIEHQRDLARPLEQGDVVLFESNSRFGPYKAYRGFPITLGDPPPAARNLFDASLEVAERCAEALRPGGHTSDVIALGDIVEQRGVATNGPLIFACIGGWQMVCQRGFTGYAPPREIEYRSGMWFQADPHVCSRDWTMATIVGNTVYIEPDRGRILGQQGMRYVIK